MQYHKLENLTVQLMKDTFGKIKPKTIVDAFVEKGNTFSDTFWAGEGKALIPDLFASGAQTLASLWNSAWELGKGDKKIKNLSAIDPNEIITLYRDKTFLPSVNIKSISDYLD